VFDNTYTHSRLLIGFCAALLAALSLGCNSTKSELVGKWMADSPDRWEFFSDGTCTVQNERVLSCTYAVLDDGRVKVEVRGEILMGQFEAGKLKMEMLGNPNYHSVLQRQTPAALEAASQQAEVARQQAEEQARFQAHQREEDNRRIAALLEQSKHRSKVIATFEAFGDNYGNDRAFPQHFPSGELTDVDVLGVFGLGGIVRIELDGSPSLGMGAPWTVILQYHDPGSNGYLGKSVCFKDELTYKKFASELDAAIKAWRAKYNEVAEMRYDGIK
jgi:hypothetical protein